VNKRGPKPLPIERRKHARVSVAVTDDVSLWLYRYAQRHRQPLSVAVSNVLERLAARERELNPVYTITAFDKGL
jgi:hypothetical protein